MCACNVMDECKRESEHVRAIVHYERISLLNNDLSGDGVFICSVKKQIKQKFPPDDS